MQNQDLINPDWFILLEQWPGETGVTLPFLVGALAHKEHRDVIDVQYVRDLLNVIIEEPVEDYVTEVQWCPAIDAPVISTCNLDVRYSKSQYENWPKRYRVQSEISFSRHPEEGESLVFGENVQYSFHLNCSTPDECLEKLVANAMEHITRGKYSKQGKGEYATFSDNDLDYIRGTIMTT